MAKVSESAFLKDDLMGFLSIFVLFVGIMFLLAQLPDVLAREAQFSIWQYVFPILGFVLGIKSKQDAVAWASVIYFSMLFMVDVFYGFGAF